jgi:enterochelin esterase family protein
MRAINFILSLLLFCVNSYSQEYKLLKKFSFDFNEMYRAKDPSIRLELIWSTLEKENHIPLVDEDSVYFLYRGEANSVEWVGDFNGWNYDKTYANKGKKISDTDLWILKSSFAKDARIDYKILINGTNWILDPNNKNQQWSGVGGGSPNSELRMPDWKEDPIQIERSGIPKGVIERDILFFSKILGYQVTYSVYLPNNYTHLDKLPVAYFTDGYEYLHPKLGNTATILDNLIADKKIKPIIAVFIDHREPINRSNNKRMQELAMNPKYLDFFTQELIPKIENEYPVISNSSSRAIIGTSMGGLTATYFAFSKPDVFGMAGIQSPAFYTRPQIYSLCEDATNPKMRISMTSGLINDTSVEARKMKDVLQANSCIYNYREVNEGHSWGNWRGLIDDVLIDLFGN